MLRRLSLLSERLAGVLVRPRPPHVTSLLVRWFRVIRSGREALRCLLARRGIAVRRTRTGKESPDPERDAELDRIEHVLDHVLDHFPDRVFAFDEFGALGIRPTAGSSWAGARSSRRATCARTPGWSGCRTGRPVCRWTSTPPSATKAAPVGVCTSGGHSGLTHLGEAGASLLDTTFAEWV